MGTPKKPAKKKLVSKSPGAKKSAADELIDAPVKKKIIDEDDDDEYDIPLDEISGYESFEGYDEDDEY